jgi:hypothetical protein
VACKTRGKGKKKKEQIECRQEQRQLRSVEQITTTLSSRRKFVRSKVVDTDEARSPSKHIFLNLSLMHGRELRALVVGGN